MERIFLFFAYRLLTSSIVPSFFLPSFPFLLLLLVGPFFSFHGFPFSFSFFYNSGSSDFPSMAS